MGVRRNKGIPVERTYPGVMAFTPNGLAQFDLGITSLVESIDLSTSGTLTLAGYTTAPTIRKEALENLVSQVSFSSNARQNGAQAVNLTSVDLAHLTYKTALMKQTAPIRIDVGTANGAYNFLTNCTKFFSAKRAKGIYDLTYLDTRLLQTFTLQFMCRDVNAMVVPGSGVAGTPTLSNVSTVVHSTEWQSGSIIGSASYVKESQRNFDLTNLSGVGVPFLNVPIGQILQRQTFKSCSSSTAEQDGGVNYADPTDGLIYTTAKQEGAHIQTQLTGGGGGMTPYDTVYSVLQNQDKAQYKQESWPVGYATFEYGRTGQVTDMLNLTNVRQCQNNIDITSPADNKNTLWITDEQIVSN